MSKLAWYARRLGKMSAAEVLGRTRDAALKRCWRHAFLRPRAPELPLASGGPDPFVLPPAAGLPLAVARSAREAVLEEAARILAGRVTVLEHESALLGERPDWFTDLRTGRSAPRDGYSFAIPYRDPAVVGDIKYVWEPSRHHHLTVLAAAFYLSGETAFAERIAQHLQSWWEENPFLCGVHWTSGIELGIRLISWVWLRRLLADWPAAKALFEGNRSFIRQLHGHQAYLAALPSRGSSANNHRVAELAGLFAAAATFPFFRESADWRAKAARGLERELALQSFPDGLNRELATAYHGLTLELFLAAAAEDATEAPLLGPAFWQGLARMMDALAAMMDCRGRPPRQGDDDGGVALAVDGRGFERWHSLLATGAALFGSAPWWPPAKAGDLRAALLAARAGPHPVTERPLARIDHFAEGGMVILRDLEPSGDELWCRCDHGPLGFLSTSAHGHADALSLELRHGGVELLCDPGTYCYHGDRVWRDYFRSTLGHNTLELDGTSQARMGGPFLWLDRTESALERVAGLASGDHADWQAIHRGYERLGRPALHRRRVRLDRRARTVEIDDTISSASPHPARLAFHLGPAIECELQGRTARLSWSAEGRRCHAVLSLPAELDWSLHRGEKEPPLGWYSAAFGLLEPGYALIGRGTVFAEVLRTHLAVFDGKSVSCGGRTAALDAAAIAQP